MWHPTDAILRIHQVLQNRGINRDQLRETYENIPEFQVCRSEDSGKNPGHLRCPCSLCDFSIPDIPHVELDEASPFENTSLASEIEQYCYDSNLLTILPVLTRSALKEIERDQEYRPEREANDDRYRPEREADNDSEEMWSTRGLNGVGETAELPALSDEIIRTPTGDPARNFEEEKDINKLLMKLRAGKNHEDIIGTQFWEREDGGRLWRILQDGPDFPTTYEQEFQMLYRPVIMKLEEFQDSMSDRERREIIKDRKQGLWNVSPEEDPRLMRWCTLVAGIRLLNEYWRRASAVLYDERAVNIVQKQVSPDSGYGIICPETYEKLEQKSNSYEKKLKTMFLVILACAKFRKLGKPIYREVIQQRREANRRKYVKAGEEETTLFISPTLGKFVEQSEEILRRAVYVILRSDQMKYLPALECESEKITKTTEDRFYNAGNVICQELRLQCEDMYRLYRTCSLPVLHPESPLLTKLIFYHHEIRETSESFLGRFPHRSVQQTAARTKSSPVGVTCTGLVSVVQSVIDTCSQCLRAFAKKYAVSAGRAYSNLRNAAGAFSVVSGDPLPATIRVRFSDQRHNYAEFSIMAFTCISTGVTILVPMPNMTRDAVGLALQDLECQTKCRVNMLITDCGSQFEKCEDINGHTRVLAHPRGAQFRSRVERSVKNIKKVWRSVFGRQKNEPFSRALTIAELYLLAHLTQAVINSFPYVKSGISPDHIARPLGYMQPFEEVKETAAEFAEHFYNGETPDGTWIYATRMKKFFESFNEERTNQIILDEQRFRARDYRGIIQIEPGDICYYKDKNEHKLAKLGRVIKLTPDGTTALVEWSGVRSDGRRNRKNIQRVAVRTLHPLVSLRQQFRLGNPSLPLPGKDYPNLVSTRDILKGATNSVNHAGCLDCHDHQMQFEDLEGRDSSEDEMLFNSETTVNDLGGPHYVLS